MLFIIEKDGTVSNVQVMRSIKAEGETAAAVASLEVEAVNAVKLLPAFRPGTDGGNPVRVEYVIPVKFALN